MDWSAYHYLLPLLLASLVAAAALCKLFPRLSSEQDQPRRTPLEVGVLLVVLALGLATLYTNYYLGRQSFGWWDVGNDTMQQYVPYYLNLLDSIRTGSLGFWNHSYGLGVSFMSYQSWTLDPFNLIVIPLCLWLGDSALSLALVVAHSAKIVLAALLFDHLLVWYCRTPLARILGSSLYAFCGYLLLWGQHYWLGGICVMAVALLVALELLRDRWSVPRFLAVALLSAASIITSTYLGFMVMLFAASYALVRVGCEQQCSSPTAFFRLYGRLALPAACGVLISAITLVPYAMLMLGESSRVVSSDGGSLTSRALGYLQSFVPLRWALPILSRLLGNSLLSSGEPIPPEVIPPSSTLGTINVFEFVSLGLSCGALVFALQWLHWVITEARLRTKVCCVIGLLFVVLYLCNAFFPALNNVFAEAKYRSSFVVDILWCLALAVGFEQRTLLKGASLPLLVVGGVVTCAVLAWSLVYSINGRLDCVAFFVAIVVLVAALYYAKGIGSPLAITLVCLALVGSSVVDGFFTTNRRSVSSAEDFPLATEPNKASDTAEALAFLKAQDNSFYRVDKLDYFDWTELNDSLVQGYPTVSSYNSTLDSDVEEFYNQLWPGIYGGDSAYQIYRNDTDQPALLRLLGVRYLLSYDPVSKPWLTELTQCGHIHVYQVSDKPTPLTLYSSITSEQAVASLANPAERVTLVEQSVIVPDELATSLSSSSTAAGLPASVEVFQDGTRLQAHTSVDGESIACLAIPHTSGWNITVDGKPVETFRADFGFIGFKLPVGTHEIVASFAPKGLLPGAILCAVGILGSLASCILGARKQKAARR